ncbi:hypothetical protein PM082_013970 [Marasmius tenuissimus]|nr:hypothetical protein PM082_013970 [Marasmius tenuissimus]
MQSIKPTKLYSCTNCGVSVVENTDEPSHSLELLSLLSETNDSPSSFEADALRGEYKDHSRVTALLDQEIAQLEASIAALDRKRKRLGARLPSYKLAMNPIRRLPNEILAYIFNLCLDEMEPDEEAHVFTSLGPPNPQWVLSQVCRKWRSLALSLPQFWTSIGANWKEQDVDDAKKESEVPVVERLLSLCLQRARDRPLRVSWGQSYSDNKLLSMLLSRSYQWKDARLACDMDGLELVSSHTGMFPELSSLCLHFDAGNWFEARVEERAYAVFCDAPSLRRLTLSGYADGWRVLTNLVPLKQITRLTITNVDEDSPDNMSDDCWDFLPRLENLRTFSLEMHEYPEPRAAPLRLNHLHTLIIRPPSTLEDDNPFLRSLILPALRILRFEDKAYEDEAEAILSLLNRSECRLEELALFGEGVNYVEDAYLAAEELKWLTTLHLGGEKLDGIGRRASVTRETVDGFQLLPPGTGLDIPVPRLRNLTLVGVKQWPDASLIKMLASRRHVDQFPAGSVARLEKISLEDGGEDGFDLRDPVAKAQLMGLLEGGLVANFS